VSKGLGKGFDALIPQNFDDSILVAEDEKIHKISVDLLVPNPEQPRSVFNEDELAGLASSIKAHGILQPLVVTPHGDSYYIIAGERRWRAAKQAGLTSVPVVIRSAKQLERLELALVENVQRVNLSPLEQAVSIEYLHEQFSLGYDVIAKRLGKSTSAVQNTARLVRLTDVSKQALAAKQITEGHARAILALKDAASQEKLLALIIKNGWSVRQAERYVVAQRDGASSATKAKAKVATTNTQTKKISQVLHSKVTIRRMAKGGKLEIGFSDDKDLQRITKLLESLR